MYISEEYGFKDCYDNSILLRIYKRPQHVNVKILSIMAPKSDH